MTVIPPLSVTPGEGGGDDFFVTAAQRLDQISVDRTRRIAECIGIGDLVGLLIVVVEPTERRTAGVPLAKSSKMKMDCPEPRPVQSPEVGQAVEIREVGGLYRHYERVAA